MEYFGILSPGDPTLKLRILSLAYLCLVTMMLATIVNSRVVDAVEGYYSSFTNLKRNFHVIVTLAGLLLVTMFTFTMGGRAWNLVELAEPIQMGFLIMFCGIWMILWAMIVNYIPSKWFSCMVYAKHEIGLRSSKRQNEMELSSVDLSKFNTAKA
jgi:hypothetical protein